MAIEVKDVAKNELPREATHGFRLVDEDHPERTIFMHWHEDGVVKLEGGEPNIGIAPEDLPVADPNEVVALVSYADVLAALPDRLAAFGYESETDAILGEVVGRYGAGE